MTAHNWPIGEPIETDESEVIATIHHVDEEGFMSGTTAHYGEFVRVALWNERGESITTRNTNLIPPKRKPRTMKLHIGWDSGRSERAPFPGSVAVIIPHPDDIPPPITREDVVACFNQHQLSCDIDALMALIESRQNNPV